MLPKWHALPAALWFGIGSTVMLTFLLAFVSSRMVEPRLGAYDPALAPTGEEHRDEPDAFAGISRPPMRGACAGPGWACSA